jgi:hypothetical protein
VTPLLEFTPLFSQYRDPNIRVGSMVALSIYATSLTILAINKNVRGRLMNNPNASRGEAHTRGI